MAQRRMFSPLITDSDAFLDMPGSAQNLYFHLGMRADDDGFVSNPKKVLRMINGADDDLKLLMAKRFILTFENGVIVIKHWRMNNLIRKDWYKPTIYQDEMNLLKVKQNGAYSEIDGKKSLILVNENATIRSRSIGKVSIVKESIGIESVQKGVQMEVQIGVQKVIDNGFELFWTLYGHKINRCDAERAWLKLKPNTELQAIIKEDIMKRKLSDRQWLEGYQPHFSTYLNGKRWEDAITLPRTKILDHLTPGTPQPQNKYANEKEIIG